jgi:hypothetical protein
MRRTDGTVLVKGSLAYAPQSPWIMSATIKFVHRRRLKLAVTLTCRSETTFYFLMNTMNNSTTWFSMVRLVPYLVDA